MGKLHAAAVHFPIALLIVAPAFELIGLWPPARWARKAGFVLLALGAAGALAAGLVFVPTVSEGALRMRGAQNVYPVHVALARATMIGATTLLLLRTLVEWRWPVALAPRVVLLGLGVGLAVLVGLTGHFGGVMVYEHGVGTQTVPSPR